MRPATKHEIGIELERLRAVFGYEAGAWELASEIYLDALSDIPYEFLAKAVVELIQAAGPGDRFPRPGQIRDMIGQRWELLRDQARRERRPDTDEWPDWLRDIWGPLPDGRVARDRAFAQQECKNRTNCWMPGYGERYRSLWFRRLTVETQRHFKEQDLARSDAFKAATPEGFAKLCVAQAEENFEMFKRNRKAMRPPMSSAEQDDYIAGRRLVAGQRELSRDEADAALGSLRQSFGLPE